MNASGRMSDDDKAFVDPGNRSIDRPITRCRTCRAWWTISTEDAPIAKCPCGGVLESVDMAAHIRTLPYVPFVPPVPAVKK